MVKIKKTLFTLISFVLLFNLTACGKSTSITKGKDKLNDEKSDQEQVLNLNIGDEPDILDSARSSDVYSTFVLQQINENLTRVEVEEDGKNLVKPGAAESWSVSDDQMEWTFKLRDLEWEDGVKVTAHDFEYGIKRVIDPATASPISNMLKHIENAEKASLGEIGLDQVGVKALDDRTLKIKLEYPVPYFLELTANREMQAQRKDKIEEIGESYGTDSNKIIANGPFKVESWVHNGEIKLVKNQKYWDAESVKLDSVNIKIITEESAWVGELENGVIDIASIESIDFVKKLDKNPELTKIENNSPRTMYVFFNHEEKLFSNPKVRKAFSLAIDREEVEKDLFQNKEKAAYGWIPYPISIDGENYREIIEEPLKVLEAEKQDPKELLIEGLRELGIEENPENLNIPLMQTPVEGKEFGEYLQQRYKKVLGVNIELDLVEWPVFQERNRQLDYVMGYKSWGGSYNDPTSFFDLWLTNNNIVPIGWNSSEYDKLIQEARQSIDKDLRVSKFKEAEELLINKECAIAPYAYEIEVTFAQKYVKGIQKPDFGWFVIKYAYIDK